jgi:hypothetical protein
LILYLDTSSLIKLYVEEHGSAEVEDLVSEASLVCTSVVAASTLRPSSSLPERTLMVPSVFRHSTID